MNKNEKVIVKIVRAPYISAFEKDIQKHLDDGWTSIWPMQVSNGNFYLAMTKFVYIDEQPPIDETITKQHPDAEKLGDKKNE